jgi:hypothetical protein
MSAVGVGLFETPPPTFPTCGEVQVSRMVNRPTQQTWKIDQATGLRGVVLTKAAP